MKEQDVEVIYSVKRPKGERPTSSISHFVKQAIRTHIHEITIQLVGYQGTSGSVFMFVFSKHVQRSVSIMIV